MDWKHERMIEKENMREGIIKRNSIYGLWYLTVLSYYVLGGLKTQKILTRKKDWKRKYEGRNHKKEFNK